MPTAGQLVASWGLFGLLLTSSVMAAGVTVGVTWLRDHLKNDKEAKFAALYLAIALEAYAEMLSDMVSNAETHIDSRGASGKEPEGIPDIPEYPDVDWRAFGIEGTQMALAFLNAINLVQGKITHEREFNPEEADYQIRVLGTHLGVTAIEMAEDFRRRRGLRLREFHPEWGMKAFLLRQEAIYKKRDLSRQAGPNDLMA